MSTYNRYRKEIEPLFGTLTDEEKDKLKENETTCYSKINDFYQKLECLKNDKSEQKSSIEEKVENNIKLINTAFVELTSSFNSDNIEYPEKYVFNRIKNTQTFAIKTTDYTKNGNEIKIALKNYPDIQKDTLRAAINEVEKRAFRNFTGFTTLERELDKKETEKFVIYYSEPKNSITKQTVNFCVINNLNFTIEQLTEIVYLYNHKIISNRENLHVLYDYINRNVHMQEYDNICLFFEIIVKKEYYKNHQKYKNIEECFVSIARMFNLSKRLYMTYDVKMDFFANFELMDNLPLEFYCKIKYNDDFSDDVREELFYIHGAGKLDSHQYIESLSMLKKKMKEIQIKK